MGNQPSARAVATAVVITLAFLDPVVRAAVIPPGASVTLDAATITEDLDVGVNAIVQVRNGLTIDARADDLARRGHRAAVRQ
jgi:hypothetical protein